MFWYRMCVVAGVVEFIALVRRRGLEHPPLSVCVCVCLCANKGGKSTPMYCTMYTLQLHNKI